MKRYMVHPELAPLRICLTLFFAQSSLSRQGRFSFSLRLCVPSFCVFASLRDFFFEPGRQDRFSFFSASSAPLRDTFLRLCVSARLFFFTQSSPSRQERFYFFSASSASLRDPFFCAFASLRDSFFSRQARQAAKNASPFSLQI